MIASFRLLWNYWEQTGEPPTARIDDALPSVEALERRYGLSLPEEFRDYLLAARLSEPFWDDENMSWWPAEQIKSLPEEYEGSVANRRIEADASAYLVFVDWMAWCSAWAICCKPGEDYGKIAILGAWPDRVVADSFGEFVSDYVSDPLGFLNRQFAILQ